MCCACAREWNGAVNTIDRIQMRKFKPEEDMILLGGGAITAVGPSK